MLYFSDRAKRVSKFDPQQHRRIERLKSYFSGKGLYWTYASLPAFEKAFRKHLAMAIDATSERPQTLPS